MMNQELLLNQIRSDLNAAMKDRDQDRVDTLRFLLGEIKNLEISKYTPLSRSGGISEGQGFQWGLTDDDVISVLQKQVKTHRESIEMFKKGNRDDLVRKELVQLSILQSYLPAQLSEDEVRSEIQKIVDLTPKADFGRLMKQAMNQLKGRANGNLVSKILRELLQ